ncbi:MAG: hypothetical protein CL762_03825 [Chloroflexi bacterium]|nr:hypothetical protein [Chloroflexota bacterium]|tara:strand:- start:2774 stop:3211 length:438 start_codon:yes stop_codon:yes gene_type:complete
MKNEFLENNNRPFAFITMCADPIHHGHINILHEAKKYGSVIVGLMTDDAMKSYKGEPLSSFNERSKVLSELRSVSGIIPVESIDFVPYLKEYKFEYFLHGDDWKQGVQKGSRENAISAMSEWGGKVIDVPYTEGVSSSDLKKGII